MKGNHMQRITAGFLLVALIALGCSTAGLPVLEPVGGLPEGCQWRFRDGPDFYTYLAQCPGNDALGAGIYFGHMPSLGLPKGVSPKDFPVEPGRVAARDVYWIVLDGQKDITPHPFYRTTIFEYRYRFYEPMQLHIWVYASNRDDLYRLLHSLSALKFKKKTE